MALGFPRDMIRFSALVFEVPGFSQVLLPPQIKISDHLKSCCETGHNCVLLSIIENMK